MLINTLDAKVIYGFALDSAPSWLDAPRRDIPSAKILRRGGARVLDTPRDQSRQLTLKGTIISTTTQDARDKIDALKLALSIPTGAQLTFDDLLTRYVIARCESFRVPPFGPSMIQRKLAVEVMLTAHDPFSYDTTLTTVAGNTPALPLGTGPMRPVITLTGAVTNPVITWKNNAGATVGSLTLTVIMIAGDVLIVDSDLKTIKLNGVNRLDLLTAGDFFTFDPADPQYQAPYGTFTVAPAPGTSTSTSYRKSWR
jgi:hypothetical protein